MREPGWWYRPERQLAATLLRPAGALYGAIARRRYRAATAYRARLPVICAGNFTAGGTGKTPFTALLASLLIGRGARPAILARGHGGRQRGPHWVDLATDRAGDVGDEPLQHAQMAPTLVARDRAAGARAIESDARDFTHILMDDGLQNGSLAKTRAVALVDGRRGLGNGAVIPAGPLRAPLDFQLRLADAIVINHGFGAHADGDKRPAGLTAFRGPVFDASIGPVGDTSWLTREPIVAFAGIGAPAYFFAMLRALGGEAADTVAFPDHHAFTASDAARLLALARKHSAQLVTTAKDLARLAGHDGDLGELAAAVRPVPIRMAIAEAQQAEFKAVLLAKTTTGAPGGTSS